MLFHSSENYFAHRRQDFLIQIKALVNDPRISVILFYQCSVTTLYNLYSAHRGISRVHWGVFNTLGTLLSKLGVAQ